MNGHYDSRMFSRCWFVIDVLMSTGTDNQKFSDCFCIHVFKSNRKNNFSLVRYARLTHSTSHRTVNALNDCNITYIYVVLLLLLFKMFVCCLTNLMYGPQVVMLVNNRSCILNTQIHTCKYFKQLNKAGG